MNTSRRAHVRGLFSAIGMCVCVYVVFLAAGAHAQLGLPGVERALAIKVEPLHPAPGDRVRLTTHSSILDLEGAEVSWRVNGKTITLGEEDSLDVTAGALGTQIDIEVSVAARDGTGASAEATIIPTELDLLIDSDSYIPPFFHGRGRASAGTNLYLQAIPQFKRPSGPAVVNSEILYTWRQNGEVLGNISGRGKSTARIPIQHLYGVERISVEARTSDGLLSNESSLSLTPIEPILTLYQNHPLYGVQYHQALGPTTFLPESEMTFAAVPYFAQASHGNDPRLAFAWHVNGKFVPQNSERPSEITINANNSSGLAQLELEVTHATNFYLDARNVWNITFSTPAANGQFGSFGQPL